MRHQREHIPQNTANIYISFFFARAHSFSSHTFTDLFAVPDILDIHELEQVKNSSKTVKVLVDKIKLSKYEEEKKGRSAAVKKKKQRLLTPNEVQGHNVEYLYVYNIKYLSL